MLQDNIKAANTQFWSAGGDEQILIGSATISYISG
jgi:hypothetical protein